MEQVTIVIIQSIHIHAHYFACGGFRHIIFVCVESNSGFQCVAGSGTRFSVVTVAADIGTITNVSGERYINDEDYNCIINLPNDIQDHQVLKEGDILISLTGNVGRVSLCKDGDYLLNQRVGLLQLAKNVNQEFLYQILSSQRFENSMIACGQGAAQMNIGKGDVESYVLPYSSNVNNILLVAKILHSYDEYIINEQRKLTLLTMQKQYFLAQMFI